MQCAFQEILKEQKVSKNNIGLIMNKKKPVKLKAHVY